jgi:hypothetical protein
MRTCLLVGVVACRGADVCAGEADASLVLSSAESGAPLRDGDEVAIHEEEGPRYVFRLGIETTGMDTREPVDLAGTAVVGPYPLDMVTRVALVCASDGTGRAVVQADLPRAFQEDPSAAVGEALRLDWTVQDVDGAFAELGSLDLILGALR